MAHIISNFAYLLTDKLEFWKKYFPACAESICNRLSSLYGIHKDPETFRVCCFYDDTCMKSTGRSVASDVIQGIDSHGAGHFHGYVFQTLELLNGMCADMYGPLSYRHTDLDLLAKSNLNNRLRNLQANDAIQYAAYGDGIFPLQSHCIGKHVGNLTAEEIVENQAMTVIKTAGRREYGVTGQLFPYVKQLYRSKMLKDPLSTKYYFVATLMRNIQVCLYGCESDTHSTIQPPTLEEYFS